MSPCRTQRRVGDCAVSVTLSRTETCGGLCCQCHPVAHRDVWGIVLSVSPCRTQRRVADCAVSVTLSHTETCGGLCCQCHPVAHRDVKGIVLSVSSCCAPRRVCVCVWGGGGGVADGTGVKRMSQFASSTAHPSWLVPCLSHNLDRSLKSPHIMSVSSSSSAISSRKSQLALVVHVEWCMYTLMRTRDS